MEQPQDGPRSSGIIHVRQLRGHAGWVRALAFNPTGTVLASASDDRTIKLWNVNSGERLHTLYEHADFVRSVAFDSSGHRLASASDDGTAILWDVQTGRPVRTLQIGRSYVMTAVFNHSDQLFTASRSGTITLWDADSGTLLDTYTKLTEIVAIAIDQTGRRLACLQANGQIDVLDENRTLTCVIDRQPSPAHCLTFHAAGSILVSGHADGGVRLWNVRSGQLIRTLEGHTRVVNAVANSADRRLLASKASDHTLRIWSCDKWETVATIRHSWMTAHPSLAVHPKRHMIACGNAEPVDHRLPIDLLELDMGILVDRQPLSATSVHHTTAKIVLVGDHSVGKSALGYRLVHGVFKEQSSTHGQQFWVLPELEWQREDGTICEAVLWDFAGQPDYRLVHALFLDNADLALILFDASDLQDPLHGVRYWLTQLNSQRRRCPIILVPAQIDRGHSTLMPEELASFCRLHQLKGPVPTSAFTGEGVSRLVELMKSVIPWNTKPSIVTTTTFKRIKDYVLGLKGMRPGRNDVVTMTDLRSQLEETDTAWTFSDDEVLAALGNLENYGYVKRLQTANGDFRILLHPERLNNLASSFVLEARRNVKGLGALEDRHLLNGGYRFPELDDLAKSEQDVLLDSVTLLFLEHNVCFREADPLRGDTYLIFPELINLKRPDEIDEATDEDVSYTVIGPTQNVFSSLVVLLGYTNTFTRTRQWRNNARYEVGDKLVCGFKLEAERDGELDFVLCFGPNVGPAPRTLFQGLFESFLAGRKLHVARHVTQRCINNHPIHRSVVREAIATKVAFIFCSKCGEKVMLPKAHEPIQLAQDVREQLVSQHQTAEKRTEFEQAIFRVRSYVAEHRIATPSCFISYAWGIPVHERWVEKRLALDLQKAGIDVVLDRWHSAHAGASITRFVERIQESDLVIVVGTPLYLSKYNEADLSTASVLAAELDLINQRLLGTEREKKTVLALLLDGDKQSSLPPLLRGRVYIDVSREALYFSSIFDLILTAYHLRVDLPALADARDSLRDRLEKEMVERGQGASSGSTLRPIVEQVPDPS